MKTISVFLLCLCVLGCASFAPRAATYYTKANIWYEIPEKIVPIYHKGTLIPAGSKVSIGCYGHGRVRFSTDDGKEFVMVNAAKYSVIGLKAFFEQYFSEHDVLGEGGAFSKFTPEEQENIKKGTIAPGMSKEAVVMAYGYPASHVTPDLLSDTWVYWKSKFKSFNVYFKENKLTLDEQSGPEIAPEEAPMPKSEPRGNNKGYLTGGNDQGTAK
jgi:hypothetical protein